MKKPQTVKEIQILKDGVFIAEDVRANTGDKVKVNPETAKMLIERGHAK